MKKKHRHQVVNEADQGHAAGVSPLSFIPGEKNLFIGIMILTLLILTGATFFLSQGSSSAAKIEVSQNVKIEVPERKFNWGEIKMSKGNAIKTFALKNSGTDVLKLTNIKTSCHCTKAQVGIDGAGSPLFGMNDVSSWVGEVLPGKEAQLKVIFDPNFHGPTGVGPIERLVSVETNDAGKPVIEFGLTGTVIKD